MPGEQKPTAAAEAPGQTPATSQLPIPPRPSEQRELTPEERKAWEDSQPKAVSDLPYMKGFLKSIGVTIEKETTKTPAEEPKTPEIKPAPETPAEKPAEKPVEKKEGKHKVKPSDDSVRRIAEEVVLKKLDESRNVPLPLPKKEDPKPEPVPAIDRSKLTREQRREIAAAEQLEKRDPANKGLAEKFVKFYADTDAYVAKAKKEDPDRTFDRDDADFVKFIDANKPRKWDEDEKESLYEDYLLEVAEDRVKKKIDPELRELRNTVKEAKEGPKVDRMVDTFETELYKELSSDDKLEKPIYERHRQAVKNVVQSYLRIENQLEPWNGENPVHKWIADYIHGKSAWFDANGGEHKMRDGKRFVTRAQWESMIAANQNVSGVWTFTPNDVMTMLHQEAVNAAKKDVETENKRLEELGYTRAKTEKPTITEETPKPVSGLMASASPAPGLASDSGSTQNAFGGWIAKSLKLTQ